MARPIKWSRDLHPIRERAARSRTETWSRTDIEELFGIGPIPHESRRSSRGGRRCPLRRTAGAARVLDEMIQAPSVDEALRLRIQEAPPPPKPKTLRVSLPEDLRRAMLPDLPANVTLLPGRIEINAATALGMLESLYALAMVMQNDLDRFAEVIEPPRFDPEASDEDLRQLFGRWRATSEAG